MTTQIIRLAVPRDLADVEAIVQSADGATPRDVQVQLIDPGTSAADATPGTPAVTIAPSFITTR